MAGAFEVQLIDEVPMEPGDRRVDLVVNNTGHPAQGGVEAVQRRDDVLAYDSDAAACEAAFVGGPVARAR